MVQIVKYAEKKQMDQIVSGLHQNLGQCFPVATPPRNQKASRKSVRVCVQCTHQREEGDRAKNVEGR
jgi:hypothetical protein